MTKKQGRSRKTNSPHIDEYADLAEEARSREPEHPIAPDTPPLEILDYFPGRLLLGTTALVEVLTSSYSDAKNNYWWR